MSSPWDRLWSKVAQLSVHPDNSIVDVSKTYLEAQGIKSLNSLRSVTSHDLDSALDSSTLGLGAKAAVRLAHKHVCQEVERMVGDAHEQNENGKRTQPVPVPAAPAPKTRKRARMVPEALESSHSVGSEGELASSSSRPSRMSNQLHVNDANETDDVSKPRNFNDLEGATQERTGNLRPAAGNSLNKWLGAQLSSAATALEAARHGIHFSYKKSAQMLFAYVTPIYDSAGLQFFFDHVQASSGENAQKLNKRIRTELQLLVDGHIVDLKREKVAELGQANGQTTSTKNTRDSDPQRVRSFATTREPGTRTANNDVVTKNDLIRGCELRMRVAQSEGKVQSYRAWHEASLALTRVTNRTPTSVHLVQLYNAEDHASRLLVQTRKTLEAMLKGEEQIEPMRLLEIARGADTKPDIPPCELEERKPRAAILLALYELQEAGQDGVTKGDLIVSARHYSDISFVQNPVTMVEEAWSENKMLRRKGLMSREARAAPQPDLFTITELGKTWGRKLRLQITTRSGTVGEPSSKMQAPSICPAPSSSSVGTSNGFRRSSSNMSIGSDLSCHRGNMLETKRKQSRAREFFKKNPWSVSDLDDKMAGPRCRHRLIGRIASDSRKTREYTVSVECELRSSVVGENRQLHDDDPQAWRILEFDCQCEDAAKALADGKKTSCCKHAWAIYYAGHDGHIKRQRHEAKSIGSTYNGPQGIRRGVRQHQGVPDIPQEGRGGRGGRGRSQNTDVGRGGRGRGRKGRGQVPQVETCAPASYESAPYPSSLQPSACVDRWTCVACDEVNHAWRSQCNCCGARPPANPQFGRRSNADSSPVDFHSAEKDRIRPAESAPDVSKIKTCVVDLSESAEGEHVNIDDEDSQYLHAVELSLAPTLPTADLRALRLLVDDRERTKNADYLDLFTEIETSLQRWGKRSVQYRVEQKKLSLADYAWAGIDEHDSPAIITAMAVERKTIRDLVSRSGSRVHLRQAQRLQSAGFAKVVMLLEGSARNASKTTIHLDNPTITSEKDVMRYMIAEHFRDVQFVQTRDPKHTAEWLAACTVALSAEPVLAKSVGDQDVLAAEREVKRFFGGLYDPIVLQAFPSSDMLRERVRAALSVADQDHVLAAGLLAARFDVSFAVATRALMVSQTPKVPTLCIPTLSCEELPRRHGLSGWEISANFNDVKRGFQVIAIEISGAPLVEILNSAVGKTCQQQWQAAVQVAELVAEQLPRLTALDLHLPIVTGLSSARDEAYKSNTQLAAEFYDTLSLAHVALLRTCPGIKFCASEKKSQEFLAILQDVVRERCKAL